MITQVKLKPKCNANSIMQLKKESLLAPSVYKAIRSTESQRLRLYELPKTYKKDLPL